jgi:hypothetical protein
MDIFTPLTEPQRADFRVAFFSHLRRRDGTPDPKTRTFDVREKMYAELSRNPVRRPGKIDPEVFARNLKLHDPEAGLDEKTLWAICAAKANRGEAYGVEYQFDHGYFDATAKEDPFLFIAIEEQYHTRVLRDALDVLGLEFEFDEPSALFQFFIKAMVKLPKALSDVLVFCSEIVGTVSFRMILDKARVLFADDPVALRQIEKLFAQILVDEVGHVYFLRHRLGPARLKLARGLLPVIANGILDNFPAGPALLGREELLEKILEADVEGAVAEFDDRFIPPAGTAATPVSAPSFLSVEPPAEAEG